MKKRGLLLALALWLFTGQSANAVGDAPAVSAQSGIVYHVQSGRVLWEKNADEKRLIASTTKMMTALLAVERCDLHETVTVTREMAEVEGSSMYLQVGEPYTVKELLYGLMLSSGNDAATALALHISGSEAAFARLMNEKAAELGLMHTSFENPHGLDGEHHYSTARDLAHLAAYAMQNSQFAEIVGTRHITIKGLTYVNHNKLLWQCEGVTGVKTGYTIAAGRTLVTCCERKGQRLICVTLCAPDDWNDHKQLYDWAYETHEIHTLVPKETRYEIPVLGLHSAVAAEPLRDVTVFAESADNATYTVELPRFVFAPVYTGEKVGRIVVKHDGMTVDEIPLVCTEKSQNQ